MYNKDINKNKIIIYKPNNLATMNTVINKIVILIRKEENYINLLESYLEIEFIVADHAGGVTAFDANVRVVNY